MVTKINFVTYSDVNMASTRFRILKPYDILKEMGHTVTVKRFPDLDADINVFSKHDNPHQIIDWMEKVKTKKIFDICDDHFDREAGDYYKRVAGLADVLTCTNSRMQKRLKKLFPKKKVEVFYDPINTLYGEPKWSETPKIIWFGHSTNVVDALPWLKEVVDAGYDLTVVSNMMLKGTEFKYIPYQPGFIEENLKNYDIVLLPTGTQDWVNMKSENRFVDALNAGCWVYFNNKELYKDFEGYGHFIDNKETLNKALQHYKEGKGLIKRDVPEIIKSGQEYIQKNFDDSKLIKQWKEIIDETLKA